MNDHSRHGATRAAGEHQHDLDGAAEHAGHGQGHEHLGHVGHADVYRRRFWITLILAVPVVVYSEMIQDWFGFTAPQFPGDGLVAPVLGTVIFLYGGSVFLTGAWSELRGRAPGMMLLVSLAISVAFLASAASTLGLFDLEFWWELSALVVVMLLGHWQEMKALGQARGALSALAELLPDEAERLRDGETERVPLDELRRSDVVLVRPGARVPADGEIVAGEAELDESMITGESKPVSKGEGDEVTAGTIATDSAIRIRVNAVGEETALAGIQRLVGPPGVRTSAVRLRMPASTQAAGLTVATAGKPLAATTTGRPAERTTAEETPRPSLYRREPTTTRRAPLSRAISAIRRSGEPSRMMPSASTPAPAATFSAWSRTSLARVISAPSRR